MRPFTTAGNILVASLFCLSNAFAADQCYGHANETSIDASQAPPGGNWPGFGGGIWNRHWAGKDAQIDVDNVNELFSVCQKNYTLGISAAPLIEDGIAYYNTWGGLLVALDYETCESRWELNVTDLLLQHNGNATYLKYLDSTGAQSASRTTPVTDGNVLYFGTLALALVVAVDKKTGTVIDTLPLDPHPLAILTQSPTVYNHRLFFGVSSSESNIAFDVNLNYTPTFHGSMHALELHNGKLKVIWTTYTIPPGAKFAGASVWGSQPSIDMKRNQVFIGTGQLFTLPEEFYECQAANRDLRVQTEGLVYEPCLPRNVYQTSVLALDIDTGDINWYKTLGPLDAFNWACVPGFFGGDPHAPPTRNCPKLGGNDTDIGMSPAFIPGSEHTPRGMDIVVAGQKTGNLWAFSAQTGNILWGRRPVPGGFGGGIGWGVAVDQDTIYYTAINSYRQNFTLYPSNEVISNSAWGAVDLKTGETKWQTAIPHNMTSLVRPVIANDVLLTGATGGYDPALLNPVGPGSFMAVDKRTGEVLRDTTLDAFCHAGVATVKDYLFFGTGYKPTLSGSFNVWKLGGTPNNGTYGGYGTYGGARR